MALDNNIIVGSADLRNTARTIRNKAGEYQSLYKKLLERDLGDLGKAWVGADADSYINKVQSFQTNFKYMYDLMMDYAEHLEKAANLYDASQTSLTEGANAL